ncbi:hypothetical protein HYU22_01470 [Candidatus Woesearchaeota archaeon]|nr:hypothetical protein [Candidatus Woesearchaeota archaeon]
MASLLELRNRTKKRQPRFVIKEAGYYPRIKKKWRFPGGRHSPVRQYHQGKGVLPTPGYGSPRAVRGLHSSGLAKVVVHTLAELQKIDSRTQGAVIASAVGAKKRLTLLAFALEKKIRVLNVKDAGKERARLTEVYEQRRKERRESLAQKQQKDEEKKKKAEEKKKKEQQEKKTEEKAAEGKSEEEQKREEQKEMIDKTITKRQ